MRGGGPCAARSGSGPAEREELQGSEREEGGERRTDRDAAGQSAAEAEGLSWGRAAASRGQEKSPTQQGLSGSAVRVVMESWKSILWKRAWKRQREEAEDESRS